MTRSNSLSDLSNLFRGENAIDIDNQHLPVPFLIQKYHLGRGWAECTSSIIAPTVTPTAGVLDLANIAIGLEATPAWYTVEKELKRLDI